MRQGLNRSPLSRLNTLSSRLSRTATRDPKEPPPENPADGNAQQGAASSSKPARSDASSAPIMPEQTESLLFDTPGEPFFPTSARPFVAKKPIVRFSLKKLTQALRQRAGIASQAAGPAASETPASETLIEPTPLASGGDGTPSEGGGPLADLAAWFRRLVDEWRARVHEVLRPFIAYYAVATATPLRRTALAAAKWALGSSIVLALAHVAVNKYVVPNLNEQVLPTATPAVSRILDRYVHVGRVESIRPLGMFGIGPVARVEGLFVGPRTDGSERTHLSASAATVSINPGASLLNGKIALKVAVEGANISLVQGDNYSWFGHPVDSLPSARNFVPGLDPKEAVAIEERLESWRSASTSSGTLGVDQSYASAFKVPLPSSQSAGHTPPVVLPAAHPPPASATTTASPSTPAPPAAHPPLASITLGGGGSNGNSTSKAGPAKLSGEGGDATADRPNRMMMPKRRSFPTPAAHSAVSAAAEAAPTRASTGSSHSPSTIAAANGRGTSDSSRSAGASLDSARPALGPVSEQEDPREPLRPSPSPMMPSSEPTGPAVDVVEALNSLRDSLRSAQLPERIPRIAVSGEGVAKIRAKFERSAEQIKTALEWAKSRGAGVAATHEELEHGHEEEEEEEEATAEFRPSGPRGLSTESESEASRPRPARRPLRRVDPLYSSRYGPYFDWSAARYTPQSEEDARAIAERWAVQKASQEALDQLRGRLVLMLASVPPPPVMLDELTVKNAYLTTAIVDETVPREFKNIDASLRLGSDFQSLRVEAVGVPGERDPAQKKVTLINPNAKTHLRDTLPNDGQGNFELHDVQPRPSPSGEGPLQESEEVSAVPPRVSLVLTMDKIAVPGVWPTLDIVIKGSNIHAPMLERLIEIPIDLHSGRASGSFRILSYDTRTWAFPELYGRVRCDDLSFHFWDATDDVIDSRMDLIFEGSRLYIHGAQGRYGAIPLIVTGDLGLNPEDGTYRLSAECAGVELNALRCTLGVRPTPYPAAGALKGIVHVTGPLEKPIFSGSVSAFPATPDLLEAAPRSWAQETLESMASPAPSVLAGSQQQSPKPGGHSAPPPARPSFPLGPHLKPLSVVGAYDRIPITRANASLTVDTATEMIHLHTFDAETIQGGQIKGSGSMWVAPQAEEDPRAVRIDVDVSDLPLKALAMQYLDGEKTEFLPSSILELGRGYASVVMSGSHIGPNFDVQWSAPDVDAAGTAFLSPTKIEFQGQAPEISGRAVLHTKGSDSAVIRAARTQEESYLAAQPVIEEVNAEINMLGLDVRHFSSSDLKLPAAFHDFPQERSMQLRLHGGVHIAGKVHNEDTLLPNGYVVSIPRGIDGTLAVSDLRVNQLEILRDVKGTVQSSPTEVTIAAGKGGADEDASEVFKMHLKMPTRHTSSRLQQTVMSSPGSSAPMRHHSEAPVEGPSGDLQAPATPLEIHLEVQQPLPSLPSEGGHVPESDETSTPAASTAAPEPAPAPAPAPAFSSRRSSSSFFSAGPVFSTHDSSGKQRRQPEHGTAPFRTWLPASCQGINPLVSQAPRRHAVEFEVAAPTVLEPRAKSKGIHFLGGVGVESLQAAGAEGGDMTPSPGADGASGAESTFGTELDRSRPLDRGLTATVDLRSAAGLELHVRTIPNGSGIDAHVVDLPLDDLEFGSLRGRIESASLALDLGAEQGSAAVQVSGPRFSGLQGDDFRATCTWDKQLFKVEEISLQQRNSSYLVQGQVVIPKDVLDSIRALKPTELTQVHEEQRRERREESAPIDSAASDSNGDVGGPRSSPGDWRVSLEIPKADLQEILPAGRLFRNATRMSDGDYDQVKMTFLDCAGSQEIKSKELKTIVRDSLSASVDVQSVVDRTSLVPDIVLDMGEIAAAKSASALNNTLKDLRGNFSGLIEASGNSMTGTANAQFDLQGSKWAVAGVPIDSLFAKGALDSDTGILLDMFRIGTGEAFFEARGQLGPESNDARFSLRRFPAAWIQQLSGAFSGGRGLGPDGQQTIVNLAGLSSSTSESKVPSLGPFSKIVGAVPLFNGAPIFGRDADSTPVFHGPINGLLSLEGTLGGTAKAPTGDLLVELEKGRIGSSTNPCELSLARAEATIGSDQRLRFNIGVEPKGNASGKSSSSGRMQVRGSVPLPSAAAAPLPISAEKEVFEAPSAVVEPEVFPAKPATLSQFVKPDSRIGRVLSALQGAAKKGADLAVEDRAVDERTVSTTPPASSTELEIEGCVVDDGMKVVSALAPQFAWKEGSADIRFSIQGSLRQPEASGSVSLSRATVDSPLLRYPITNLTSSMTFDSKALQVEKFEGRIGKKGSFEVSGTMPFTRDVPTSPSSVPQSAGGSLRFKAKDVELKRGSAQKVFDGVLDTNIIIEGSPLSQPTVSGQISLQRGSMDLLAASSGPSPQLPQTSASGAVNTAYRAAAGRQQLLRSLLDAAKVDSRGSTGQLVPEDGSKPILETQIKEVVKLKNLKIVLGPDLKATYPLVLNINLSGSLDISGSVPLLLDDDDANQILLQSIKPSGFVRFNSGEINLLATQFRFLRDRPSQIVFAPDVGFLDPQLDVSLVSSGTDQLRITLLGKASRWSDNLILSRGSDPGDPASSITLTYDEAARLFEKQLQRSLLEDGQLAFPSLAASTVASLMPKLETAGQFGRAKWRLMGSPSLPALVSLDPSLDTSKIIKSLTMGAEVEVHYGKLRALAQRSLRDDVNNSWNWQLTYQLNRFIRAQLSNTSSPTGFAFLIEYSRSPPRI